MSKKILLKLTADLDMKGCAIKNLKLTPTSNSSASSKNSK